MILRRATITDVPTMGQIINDCAEYGLMLPRSLASLYENVRDFHVAESDHRVIGTCGLAIVWANLAEVYALAVDPAYRGKGFGHKLVAACLDEARRLGVRRIMTLTYEKPFFEKLGFTVLDRQQLPLKVWSECVRCPKNQQCDEIAMVRILEDVPEAKAPEPRIPPADEYVVPITHNATRIRPAPGSVPAPAPGNSPT
jgi:amino-acid N-acetyltransferase